MTLLQTLILSVVEGITEFLPISSTGHLILAGTVIGVPQTEFTKNFDVIIQAGAILAVTILYFRRFFTNRRIMNLSLIAFLPTATIGFLLYKIIKQHLLGNPMIVVTTLAVGGVILILLERRQREATRPLMALSPKQAFLIGLCQTVSVIPGVSRSAATIVGGLETGLSRADAVLFSFYLAIPTMAAATGYDFLKSYKTFSSADLTLLAVGFTGSFITAWITMKWFLKYVRSHSLAVFGWYRIGVALLFLVVSR